jgi:hypothetical protein
LTKIDETTGLAALPEDFFWRVKEQKLGRGTNPAKDVGGVTISLIRKKTTVTPETTTTEYVRHGLWKTLMTFKQGREVTTVTPETTETREIVEAAESLLLTTSTEPKKPEEWAKYTISWDYGYSYTYDKRWYKVIAPSPDNLRGASVRCWEEYINHLHEIALEMNNKRDLDRILGDYPPKSVKDLVNA